MPVNPCLGCGACCAFFRASFYWAEAEDGTPGGVPVELTENLNSVMRIMKGTGVHPPRCIALHGEIGSDVFCTVHSVRPTVCREFPASYIDGVRNERCDQARLAYGLRPLTPEDYIEPLPEGPTDPGYDVIPAA